MASLTGDRIITAQQQKALVHYARVRQQARKEEANRIQEMTHRLKVSSEQSVFGKIVDGDMNALDEKFDGELIQIAQEPDTHLEREGDLSCLGYYYALDRTHNGKKQYRHEFHPYWHYTIKWEAFNKTMYWIIYNGNETLFLNHRNTTSPAIDFPGDNLWIQSWVDVEYGISPEKVQMKVGILVKPLFPKKTSVETDLETGLESLPSDILNFLLSFLILCDKCDKYQRVCGLGIDIICSDNGDNRYCRIGTCKDSYTCASCKGEKCGECEEQWRFYGVSFWCKSCSSRFCSGCSQGGVGNTKCSKCEFQTCGINCEPNNTVCTVCKVYCAEEYCPNCLDGEEGLITRCEHCEIHVCVSCMVSAEDLCCHLRDRKRTHDSLVDTQENPSKKHIA